MLINLTANETSSTSGGAIGAVNNGQSSAPNHQSTLDEITNKVFNELLQRKVDAHAHGLMPKTPTVVNQLPATESMPSQSERKQHHYASETTDTTQAAFCPGTTAIWSPSDHVAVAPKQNGTPWSQHQPNAATSTASQMQPKRLSDAEDGGGRSDDWCSETSSSNVGQLRLPIAKGRAFVAANRHRKYTITPSAPLSLGSSGANVVTENGPMKLTADGSNADESSKKPLIAIWKAGVKLQNASSPTQAQAENNGS